jgi:aspartyl-tRNA(Asn)/glutamyl-tRNA(Gln) amidotransferase subunit C
MIEHDEVRHVAKLARLRLEEGEVPRLAAELGAILEAVSKVAELATVEPAAPAAYPLTNGLAADEVEPSLARADALANAPQPEGDYFGVPS